MSTAAPDTKAIYNFKGNFDKATCQVLSAAGCDALFLERGLKLLKLSGRIELTFDLGEALNTHTLPDGSQVYDYYNGRLRLRVLTARRQSASFPETGVREIHDQMVCGILDALEERKGPFTEVNLPWYKVNTIRPLGTRSDFNVIDFEDFTDVDFALEFGIRSTAWPVAA